MNVRARLDRYWFEPAPLRDLAWLRIAIVFALWADAMWPDTLTRQLQLARLPAEWFGPLPALKLLMLLFGWGARPSAAMIVGAWVVCGGAGILALIGAYTRVSLTVFATATTLLLAHFYSYGTMEHPQAAATIVLWMLILTPCGESLSVDAMRVRARMRRLPGGVASRSSEATSPDARWPLRVAQWLLVIVYLSAALAKVTIGKAAWMNGYTMTYYLLLDGSRHHIPLAIALAHVHWLAIVMALGALAFELTFVACVLFPRTAPLYLAAGVALHTGIAVLMQAPFYQLLALYVAFAEPVRAEVHRWLNTRTPRDEKSPGESDVRVENGPDRGRADAGGGAAAAIDFDGSAT